jgi:hypothetical protein
MALTDLLRSKPHRPTSDDLARCERVIAEHVASYATVGAALREIRDRQLYRLTHDTFEQYISERWHMDRTHAYRLIDAAGVAQNLSPTGNIPPTERQARPLAALAPAEQLDAWQEAQQLAGGTPTADQVEAICDRRKPRKKKTTKRIKPLRIRVPGAIVTIEPSARGFTTYADAISQALGKLDQARAA